LGENVEHLLHIQGRFYGDKRLIWRGDDEESKRKAIDAFKEKLELGWLAYKVDPKDPKKATLIKDFDEKASKIVITPPVTRG
jgi:hypothetical protein